MRSRLKMWRNARGGKWTCRIIWFGEGKDCENNIRLECECEFGTLNLFPKSKEEADTWWEEFRGVAKGDMQAFRAPPTDQEEVWTWMKGKR